MACQRCVFPHSIPAGGKIKLTHSAANLFLVTQAKLSGNVKPQFPQGFFWFCLFSPRQNQQ